MKYKKTLICICLIILFMNIACVTASEVNNTINEEAQISNTTIYSSFSEDVLGEDDSTFTALQKIIDQSGEGSTVNLDRDYTYDEGFLTTGMIIGKDLTINGNGHTINGLSKSRIFIVTLGLLNHNKVTLKNIKFVNGHTNLYGGAIFNYGDLTIDNCEFNNNYAKYCGGAINSVGVLDCVNSKFNNNVAGGDGGAVFTLSIKGTLKHLRVIINDTVYNGNMNFIPNIMNNFTIIYATESINNCVFTNNVANGRGGGAVYAFGNIDINSCTFSSNKAGEKGGAVFANKDLNILNSKFTANQVPMYGGAVYFKCHDQAGHYENRKWVSEYKYYTGLIKDSTFTKNVAGRGGAVYAFRTSPGDTVHCIKVVSSTFGDNKASSGRDVYGGTTSKCVFNYLKLTLKTVKIKKSAKKLVLTAKLTKGKSFIKNKKIIFKFNGKKYTAKTSKKGIAKVIIKKSVLKKLKVGKKVKYQAKYKKLIVKKTAKVKK